MANIQISVDDGLKEELDVLFNQLGTTTEDAGRIFYKQALREQGFPFKICLNEDKLSEGLKESIKEAFDISDGNIVTTTYHTVDELLAALYD